MKKSSYNLPEAFICLIQAKRVETIYRMAKSKKKNSVLLRENGKFTTENPLRLLLQNIFRPK